MTNFSVFLADLCRLSFLNLHYKKSEEDVGNKSNN